MTKRFSNSKAASTLYNLGISFHEFGTLTESGVALFDYYKCDSVTAEQRAALLAIAPDVQFKGASPSYAPEIRKALVCFPKAAFYRRHAPEMESAQ